MLIFNLFLISDRKRDPYSEKWKLQGKTLKGFTTSNINTIVNKLENIILQYDDVREIRHVGGGGKWIKTTTKRIGVIFYIDKFHYNKSINDIVGKDKPKKKLIYSLIEKELPKKIFKIKLLQLIANNQYGELSKK